MYDYNNSEAYPASLVRREFPETTDPVSTLTPVDVLAHTERIKLSLQEENPTIWAAIPEAVFGTKRSPLDSKPSCNSC